MQSEARGFQKSKKEKEEDAVLARELALTTALDTSSKGFKMMAKLGYKPGAALGKSEDARTEPIKVTPKEDKSGIGHENEKKRKILEKFQEAAKKVKVDEDQQEDYRERLRQEREDAKILSQIYHAQKVIEQLDTEADEVDSGYQDHTSAKNVPKVPLEQRTLKSINVLWRGRRKTILQKKAESRMKFAMQQRLSKLPVYDDADEDELDQMANSTNFHTKHEFFEDDLYEDDEELADFEALSPPERLDKMVMYLRDTYHYCFWCKHKYEDSEMEGCPGLLEEEHD